MRSGRLLSPRAAGREALDRGRTASRAAPVGRSFCSRCGRRAFVISTGEGVVTACGCGVARGRNLTLGVAVLTWTRSLAGARARGFAAETGCWGARDAVGRIDLPCRSAGRRLCVAGVIVLARSLRDAASGAGSAGSLTGSLTTRSAGVGGGDEVSTVTGGGGAATGGSD